MFLALKYDFSVKKDKKDHNFSVSAILDMEDSILNTFRFCEKVRDLGFRSIRDIIFSGLVKYQWGAMKRLIWWKEPLEASPTLWSTLRRCLQVEFQSTKKFTSWENVQEKNFKDFVMPSIYETMPESRVSKKMIFYIPRKCRRNFLTTFFAKQMPPSKIPLYP